MVYNSSLGGNLHAVHSGSPDDDIKLTAAELFNVFPQSMRRTKSQELKVALCITSNKGQNQFNQLGFISILYENETPCT